MLKLCRECCGQLRALYAGLMDNVAHTFKCESCDLPRDPMYTIPDSESKQLMKNKQENDNV